MKALLTTTFLSLLFGLNLWGHNATLHHWEKPSNDPDRIILTPLTDPTTSAAVSWRTSETIKEAYAEIIKATDDARFDVGAEQYKALTKPLEFGKTEWNKKQTVHYHTVNFTELKPNTLYAYRVGSEGYWSEWIQFRTAPAIGSNSFSFIYFGDAQNSVLSHWSRVIRAAYQKAPNANFALHAGDLINRAHHDTEWAEWFKAGGWIHASLLTLPVSGNHEYDADNLLRLGERVLSLQWNYQFSLPQEQSLPEKIHGTVYTHDIANAKIIILNTNREIDSQIPWLEKSLKENTQKWIIVSFHHPVFSSGRDRDNSEQRQKWKPLFDEYQVDLILQGHDHTYARGQVPVHFTDPDAAKDAVATVYVNSVSGPKMYGFNEKGWDNFADYGVNLERKAENTQFFQVINVESDQLTYHAYTATGKLYDGFQIRKNQDGSKEVLNIEPELKERVFENTKPYDQDSLPY